MTHHHHHLSGLALFEVSYHYMHIFHSIISFVICMLVGCFKFLLNTEDRLSWNQYVKRFGLITATHHVSIVGLVLGMTLNCLNRVIFLQHPGALMIFCCWSAVKQQLTHSLVIGDWQISLVTFQCTSITMVVFIPYPLLLYLLPLPSIGQWGRVDRVTMSFNLNSV